VARTDLDDFQFEGTPINETLVRDLAGGGFLTQQRNAVLVGGTGTGKTHLAIAIARSCIRAGTRGRFYNVVVPSGSSCLHLQGPLDSLHRPPQPCAFGGTANPHPIRQRSSYSVAVGGHFFFPQR
jgi:hypothetical protein